MFDINEIRKRAQAASDAASRQLNESMEKSRKITEQMQEDMEAAQAAREAGQQQDAEQAAAQQRQVEILGQMFSPDVMAQMAATEEMIQKAVDEKVAEAAALGVEGMMNQFFGDDTALVAAALETLAMEEEDEDDPELDQALEEELYRILEEKLAQIDRLPEPEPIVYPKGDPRWEQFGILLSGIISHLNDHRLDGMDVEEHIPVMEQQIASLVRRSWGISGRGELLDTIRYFAEEGYVLRCRLYGEASSPEALMEESDDEEECASVCRGWRFSQYAF